MRKLYLTIAGICLSCLLSAQSLVSISSDTSVVGQGWFNATITGIGTIFQSSSPPNSIVGIDLIQASTSTVLPGYVANTVLYDTVFDAAIYIPASAPLGNYDLRVQYYDQFPFPFPPTPVTVTLPNAVTHVSADGFVQGKVFQDLNQNGILDGTETGKQSAKVIINPGNFNTITDVNGDYSFPLKNGNYTVSYSTNGFLDYLFVNSGFSNPISFTINNANSTLNNFPLHRALKVVNPDTAWLGQAANLLVVSDTAMFTPTNVSTGSYVTLEQLSSPHNSIPSLPQYTFIDSHKVALRFNIPNIIISNYLGKYRLMLHTNLPYAGNHILDTAIEVVPIPLYISGKAFLDIDSNGVQGVNEPGLQNQKITLSPDSSYAFTNLNGDYSIGSSWGTKTIEWVPSPDFYLAPNNPAQYIQPINSSTGGFNFGLLSIHGDYGCYITYWNGFARCNTSSYGYGSIQNIGMDTINGWVYVIKSPNMAFGTSSPVATYINGDTAAWNITNLAPLATQNFSILQSFPPAGSGYTSKMLFNAVDGAGNIQCSKEYGVTNGIVSCAFDPNDKSVEPPGIMQQHYTLMGDTLNYLIRFQNTGNDTAFIVLVRDTLDANLDLNTFSVNASSHLMYTELDLQTRVAKFTFNNILLPDSNVNEPASHGFISYSVNVKAGLPTNTIVTNDADIYFDYNIPVITNETFNEMMYVLPVGISEIESNLFNVKVIPNPFENFASIQFDNEKQEMFVLKIYSIDGKLVHVISSNQNSIALSREKMNSGLYVFELKNNASNEITRGRFIVK